MKRAALALGLCVACATVPAPTTHVLTEGLPARWLVRPVIVAISAEFECPESLAYALAWWEAQGVSYLVPRVVSQQDVCMYTPCSGVIAVSADAPVGGPETLGETDPVALDGALQSARIRVRRCDEQTLAHEFGHALGLEHSPYEGALMYPAAIGGGWAISTEELDVVR